MKYLLLTAFSFLLYMPGAGASTGISSGYSSGAGRYEYILGEPVAGSVGSGNMLTAGFLQGIITVIPSGIYDVIPDVDITFKLFPNPVKALLKIAYTGSFTESYADMEFCLFDNKGALAYSCKLKDSESEIDLSHLPGGIYIACIKNAAGDKIFESKIIKNNSL